MIALATATRFRRWLALTELLLFLLVIAAFLLAYRGVQRAHEVNSLVAHTQDILQEVGRLRLDRARLRNNFFAFNQTRNPGFFKAFEDNRADIEAGLARLRSLTPHRSEQRHLLDALAPALHGEADALQHALRLGVPASAPAPGSPSAQSLLSAVPSEDETLRLMEKFEAGETALFHARSSTVQLSARFATGLLVLTGSLTVLILLAGGYVIQREIMKREKVELGFRRAQEILGVRYGEQRLELGHAVEDLHEQIRARNRAEEELRRLNEELESRVESRTTELQELNRELEAFTYSVSHDLKAPLRHMEGFSRILQQEFAPELPEEARHYLDRVRTAATHMSALVDDLLRLSRVGRQPPRLQPVSLQMLAEHAKEEVLLEAPGRCIEWRFDLLPDVQADPLLLGQVLTNLFSNALKFTRKKPVAVIQVSAHPEPGKVVITVKDNGAGFDPRYADKLFGVFQRLHRQDEYEGTGVGLATVQRIVHKHGGRVWAESRPGQGATFYFTLPAPEHYGLSLPEAVGANV